MQPIDGDELIRKIRHKDRYVNILIISGRKEFKCIQRLSEDFENIYILFKPFSPKELREYIKEIINKSN